MIQVIPLQLEGIEYWGLLIQRPDGAFNVQTFMSREKAMHVFNRLLEAS